MKENPFIHRHISSVPILQCSAASRRRCTPIWLVLLLVVSLVPLTGCTLDSNIQDIHNYNLASASRSERSAGLKLTMDYAAEAENSGDQFLDSVVIKTVMTCKNQGMKFVKWTRRCKFSQTSVTEQVYKFLAVSIALIL